MGAGKLYRWNREIICLVAVTLRSLPSWATYSSIQYWARCPLGCKGTKNGAQTAPMVFERSRMSHMDPLSLPYLSLWVSAHFCWPRRASDSVRFFP